MNRDWSRTMDILDAAERIARNLPGTRAELDGNEVLEAALVRWLTVIGEAAAELSADYRMQHPDVEWSQIIGMRHRLIHDYAYVDLDVVWEAAVRDVPELADRLRGEQGEL